MRSMRERYQSLDDTCNATKLEVLELEKRLNSQGRSNRQRFDHVKKAFRVRRRGEVGPQGPDPAAHLP